MSDPRRDIPDQIKRHFFREAVERPAACSALGRIRHRSTGVPGVTWTRFSTGRSLPISRWRNPRSTTWLLNLAPHGAKARFEVEKELGPAAAIR
jgi:hypothetical protein